MSEPDLFQALDRREIARIFERYFRRPIAQLEMQVARPLQGPPGMAGDKSICRIMLHCEEQKQVLVECCIKRMRTPDLQEAIHYRFLHARQLPLPEFYGHYLDAQRREVLLLEYLPRVGIDRDSDAETAAWIALVARFNATPIDKVHRRALQKEKWGDWLIDGSVEKDIQQIIKHAEQAEIGQDLQTFCRTRKAEIQALGKFARSLHSMLDVMPKALCNQELYPGWRQDGTLVGFDLHSTTWGPQCLDVVNLLGAPETHLGFWDSCLSPRLKWAQVYVESLLEAGGPTLEPESVLREAQILWMANAFHLAWGLPVALTGEINWSDDKEKNKASMRARILSQLTHLTIGMQQE